MMKLQARRSFLFMLLCLFMFAPMRYAAVAERKSSSQPRRLFKVTRGASYPAQQSGFIDSTGRFVIRFGQLPPATMAIGEFHEGLAAIYVKPENVTPQNMRYKAGYVDETGRLVIPPRFDEAHDFSEGLAFVSSPDFRGFINRKGQPVFKVDPGEVKEFHEGLAAVGTRSYMGEWGYIDRAGRLVIKMQYQFADDFSEGLAAVVVDWKYGFINQRGQMVIEPRFEPQRGGPHGFGIGGTSHLSEGLACVKVGSLRDYEYNKKYGSKYGYINKQGDFVIPPQFDTAQDFSEGAAWVGGWDAPMKSYKAGLIDQTGRWVLTQLNGQSFGAGEPGKKFSEGLAPFVVKNAERGHNLWGYMDHNGRVVIKPQFVYASLFDGGLAEAQLEVKSVYAPNKTGYVDKHGQFIEIVYGFINKRGTFVWCMP